MSETSHKLSLLRDLATRNKLDAILLQRVSSVAWATSGATSYVNTARSDAESSLLITADKHFLFTNNIEAPRLDREEQLGSQGWDFQVSPWFEKSNGIQRLTAGLKIGVDFSFPGAVDLSSEIAHLRANLNPEEVSRFRMLGQLCAQAMNDTSHAVHPGLSEYEIAGFLAHEAERRGVQDVVNLVAVDERIYSFRHPLPTGKKLGRYAMIILCGRRWGLVCSLTRLVHFGALPEEIRRKAEAVAQVDAAMITATRPGSTLGQVFAIAQQAYAASGYPDEWRLHHQGGPAGYEPREYIATPHSVDTVMAGQVYAWNPSITGCKSEDSVLVDKDGFEVLTAIPGWPTQKVDLNGRITDRPDILVME